MTTVTAMPLQIGPYRVLQEVGRGGMGVVYRAERISPIPHDGPSQVALKMPSRDLWQVFGALRREIHALGRLRHPGVVRILDEGIEDGVPWYAMELLEGESLAATLALRAAVSDKTAELADGGAWGFTSVERPVLRSDLPRALTLMHRLAHVLAFVHSHGIVHRDLKPDNVIVRPGDLPVLVDFGVVAQFRAITSREVVEVSGRPTGTALYVAPEQARGELVDARADLYSFGVMLYEIVTGRPPFDGNSVPDILRRHVHDTPAPPSTIVHDVSPRLEQLILRLLEKDREARPGYAEDVARWLVDAGATPGDGEPATAPYLYRPQIIGRRETIDATGAVIERSKSGDGAFVLLGGVSGIGKSAIATIIARQATLQNLRVVTGESVAGGAPLHPLRALLRDIADRCRSRRDVAERVLGARLGVLHELDPTLAALRADLEVEPVAPAIASRRLFADLGETLAAYSREQPLLLIIDDLQWADEVTIRFLSSLGADYFHGLPIAILGTYRADEAGPELRTLISASHVRKVAVDRLDDASVGEIVRSMLAAPDMPPAFLHFLAAQTEGNPFFVAEYLRSAVAERILYRENGHWRIAAADDAYESLTLPGTIRELLSHRLARLSPLARRAGEAAAVLGREFSLEQFLGVFRGGSDRDALDAIAELIEQHVFEPAGEHIRFAHDKLREAAYAEITEPARRELHGRAVTVIEKACTSEDELKQHAGELARHCDAAGMYEKATGYYARAAESLVGTGACREAIELMNRALALDESLPDDKDGRERRAHWERVLSFAHFGLGDLPGASDHARRSLSSLGIELPETATEWRRQLAVETLRQLTHVVLPRAVVRSRGSKPVLRDIAMAAQKFSEARYYTDEKTAMLASGLLAVNSAERLGDAAGLIHTYANFGAVTSGHGLNRIARRYYEKARRLAHAAGDHNGLGHIGYTSAVLYITTCDWRSCKRYFDDAVEAAKKTGDHQLIEMNLIARGFYDYYRGRVEKAADVFDSVRERAHKRLNRQHEAWGHTWRAACLMLMNRLDEAIEGLDTALDRIAALGDNAKLSSYALRCQALLHAGRFDEAVAAADLTSAAVAKIPAIIWEKYRGLSAPAEVYLGALERGVSVEDADRMRAETTTLLRRLDTVSRRMPLARPVALRLLAIREYVDGKASQGEALLRKSIAAAVRYGLPLDEAIGSIELSQRLQSESERRSLQHHAREILSKTGCSFHLNRIEGA